MFTYSGQSIGSHEGAPIPEDVAVALGRIPRLCGASDVWWSYLHHSAALLEIALWENLHYKLDETDVATQALVHDAYRAVTLLWEDGRQWELRIRERIYASWDIPFPDEDSEMAELISRAAARVFRAEVRSFAPRAMKDLPVFDDEEYTCHSDLKIIDAVWDSHSSPDSTANPRSEAVAAYTRFFNKPNVTKFRHKFGYLKGAYDEQRYQGRFKLLETTSAEDPRPGDGPLPADS